MKKILEVNRLTKKFHGISAVSNIKFECYENKIHGIIGPNGAGKTTLINLLAGDIFPDSGEIIFKNINITNFNQFKISRIGIGRSYQITNLFFSKTVFENCLIAYLSKRTYFSYLELKLNKVCKSEIFNSIKKVGLLKRKDSKVSELSYGEQRQVEIAMVLLTEPELILLDEPLAGMSNEDSKVIMEIILELSKKIAIIIIEHDTEAIFEISDIIFVMQNGRIVRNGNAEKIKSDDYVKKIYMGE